MDDFSLPSALADAAACPGAQLFVYPAQGQVEAIFVLAPDRLVWELRSEESQAWFDQFMSGPGVSLLALEAGLAAWCEWVPRLFRGAVLGIESADDVEASRH